jgi:MoaA/NifB/PqqE/SkfB family radical SAM enzyme
MASNVARRRSWFIDGASAGQLKNTLLAGTEFVRRKEVMRAWPVLLKVDISPACNLGCTFCVHAEPELAAAPNLLVQQNFRGKFMPVDRFQRMVDEIAGKTSAVSLYYLGDPLLHPDLVELCGISRSAGLKTHISSNFSFRLSDERIRELVNSGLSHLTVCVESLQQERFTRTRVGGNIDWVLENLERVLAFRRERKSKWPHVEVQFIKFQHNLDELEDVAAWCQARGVDQFTVYWGNLHNYADVNPGQYQVDAPKPGGALPRCSWPHFSMQVKYDGSTIPCCYYRHSDQYRAGADDRSVGNIFDEGVLGVWNSPAYQHLRRLVSDPERAAAEPMTEESFCHGCSAVYETDAAARELVGSDHRWEEIYVRESDGRMRRL